MGVRMWDRMGSVGVEEQLRRGGGGRGVDGELRGVCSRRVA